MGVVIDTSALVTLERRGTEWMTGLGPWADEEVALPAIVYGELLAGVALAGNTRRAVSRRAKIDALVGVVGVTPFDGEVAAHWSALFALLSKKGRMIPSNDLAVASTARHLGFAVVVGPNDEHHFRAVPNLVVYAVA